MTFQYVCSLSLHRQAEKLDGERITTIVAVFVVFTFRLVKLVWKIWALWGKCENTTLFFKIIRAKQHFKRQLNTLAKESDILAVLQSDSIWSERSLGSIRESTLRPFLWVLHKLVMFISCLLMFTETVKSYICCQQEKNHGSSQALGND